jgi:thiol-disulfide isomerase/thioredoxin
MKQVLIICLLIVSLIGSAYAGRTKDFPDNLTFTMLDGKTVDSAVLKSTLLVLILSASWCPECKRQAPEVQKAYLEYKDKGVQFLCVLGGSRDDDIKEFLATYKVTFPLAKDNGIIEFLDVRAIPQTFFFSKGGKFEKMIIGPVTYRELTSNMRHLIRVMRKKCYSVRKEKFHKVNLLRDPSLRSG